jgi:hypothetical protein
VLDNPRSKVRDSQALLLHAQRERTSTVEMTNKTQNASSSVQELVCTDKRKPKKHKSHRIEQQTQPDHFFQLVLPL